MKFSKFLLFGAVLFIASQSAHAFTYGCGYYTGTRTAVCLTVLNSSEFGTFKQVAVRVTQASGQTYNYGGSNWSLGRSDIRIHYTLLYPSQTHTIAGSHCAQYYNNNYVCYNSSYSFYL